MIAKMISRSFFSHNERILRSLRKTVDIINQMEREIEKLSDSQLTAKTAKLRSSIKNGESINTLLPEAFSVVREASKRVFGMRHFDVQLLGGIVLNSRCIAEMSTGEGKTLTATLPAYLNSLSGKGVHVVTVNDYLAQRDAENNRPLFELLGISLGINLPGLSAEAKRAAYAADITYGTNNEYGFDYLRDNMVFSPKDRVQRPLHYALVDEVDSILIDEARTPLIISGPSEDSSDRYRRIDQLIPHLIRQDKEDSVRFHGNGHFSVDEKSRQVNMTERGLVKIEELMVKAHIIKEGESLYSSNNIILMHHVNAALRAHFLFTRDIDYIVKNKEVVIVDEHTGRTMPGRRWSDGLHQAIEAKENVKIQNENQVVASITFQNYFRLYHKLAGMTGTASSDAFEFRSIYKLDTIVVPTNRQIARKDLPDLIYMTEKDKIRAIVNDIKACNKRGQPVLVGTISIEKSEIISQALKSAGIQHKVLNAKFHAMEADIIAQAGKLYAVTIATNMAGRGTDIVLGGNWQAEISMLSNPTEQDIINIKNTWQTCHNEVLATGGLHVIVTERHESRRIDNQLRGRAGRQGDAGSSRFYLSMEDTLMRIFASDRISSMMRKLGMQPGDSIEHSWVTKAIANAQRKVENRNFDIRKQLLEYDDVASDQRRAIYSQRNEILNVMDISDTIASIRNDVLKNILDTHFPPHTIVDMWDISGLEQRLKDDFTLSISIDKQIKNCLLLDKELLLQYILKIMLIDYQKKESVLGSKIMRNFEKSIFLQTIDSLWKEHLAAMDYLRQGIHLRCYAQKDPMQEYKKESFAMFSNMLELIKYEVISRLCKIELHISKELKTTDQQYCYTANLLDSTYNSNSNDLCILEPTEIIKTSEQKYKKIGRNEPCPCCSGKKFKQCDCNLYHEHTD